MYWGYSKKPQDPHGTQKQVFQMSDTPQNNVSVYPQVILSINNSEEVTLQDWHFDHDNKRLQVKGKVYSFDQFLTQDSLESFNAEGVVDDILQGYNYNLLTYGQSKTGKTKTMFQETNGICIRILQDLLSKFKSNPKTNCKLNLSIFEVFAESVYDLLIPTTSKKPLKLYHPSTSEVEKGQNYDKNDYLLKNLTVLSVHTIEELLKPIIDINSVYHEARKSHVFIRINIELYDTGQDTIRKSTLQIIDLKDIDPIALQKDIPSDSIRKCKLGMNTLEKVIDILSRQKKINSTFKESNLTRLLYGPLLNNFKNLLLISCSSDPKNEIISIQTLNFASKFQKVENFAHRNHLGLNAKRKMDLFVEDMLIKEDNYKMKLKLMNESLSSLTEGKSEADIINEQLRTKEIENEHLKEQINMLRMLKRNKKVSNNNENAEDNKDNEQDEKRVMQVILEKCEEIAQLQLAMEEVKHKNVKLEEEFKNAQLEKLQLEEMNAKLLQQINSQEKSLSSVLSHNAILQNDITNMQDIKSRQTQQIIFKENVIKAQNENNKLNSISEGSSEAYWKRRPSSINSSPKSHKHDLSNLQTSPRPLKNGLKLKSLRIVSNPVLDQDNAT